MTISLLRIGISEDSLMEDQIKSLSGWELLVKTDRDNNGL